VEVRVCDTCEISLREASGASEKMDVTSQITSSLKQALKDKAKEAELFNLFLMHVIESTELEDPTNNKKLSAIQLSVESLCQRLQRATDRYNDLKMSSVELERDIRAVAQRCIKAEDLTREGLTITRQIEEYSSRIGSQARLIDQLTERIDRLSNPESRARSPEPSAARRSVEITEHVAHHTEGNRASVCEVLKSLVTL
jgi:predicted  nucleic acid-binding Zn-ribbon protein